jgi:solute carrier family 35, member E1
VYAALLPVVGGVALACLKELDFSWVSFGAAMASNLLFALRANFSKVSNHCVLQYSQFCNVASQVHRKACAHGTQHCLAVCALCKQHMFAVGQVLMDKPLGKNMQPANLYAVVTMLAFVLCIPVALVLEWKLLVPVWESAVAALTPSSLKADGAELRLVWLVVLSGLTHYLNNEVLEHGIR